MPVVQLQDNSGANFGAALGTAAGYFATQKQRKADKQAATDRQAATDARTNQAAIDTHNNITSEIASRQHTAETSDADVTNTQFQQGAYAKASAMLQNRPKGVSAQQWVAHVQQQLPTLGLTDPKLLGQLYGEGQGVLTQAEADEKRTQEGKVSSFQSGLKYPPNWNKLTPQKQIAYLQQRLNSAQRIPGADKIVTETNAEIGHIQQGLNQSGLDADRKVREGQGQQRISISIDRANRSGSGGAGISPRADAIETQAMGAKDQKAALRILEQAGLPLKERNLVRQDIMDQFRTPTAHDTSGLSNAGKEAFQHDVTAWSTSGMDPANQPDPADPKYQKRAAALGTPSGGGGTPQAPKPKPVMHNGKAYYLHSDGNYYLTP